MKLAQLLGVRPGITAVIGSGGKTSLLRTLAGELDGRVLLCTTTHIYPFSPWPLLTRNDPQAIALALRDGPVCVGTPAPQGKLTAPGLPLDQLAALTDYLLVEADGSRGLPLKAHRPGEPVLPAGANPVICVVGAGGFGQPIRQAAHRPERFAALAGVTPDAPATPALVGRVLRAEGLADLVFVNAAETPQRLAGARELASVLPWPTTAGSLRRGVWQALP